MTTNKSFELIDAAMAAMELKIEALQAERDQLRAEVDALRAERDAHVAAVSAGGWYQGDDRTCGPSATTCRFIRDDDGIVAYVDGGTRAEAAARGARIVACVNACTGVADPGALVQAARDAVDWIGAYVPDSVGGREFTLTNLRRALGALLRDQEEDHEQ